MPKVDTDILKAHVNKAQLNGAVFWTALASGFLSEAFPQKVKIVSSAHEDYSLDRLTSVVSDVYSDIYRKYGGRFTPAAVNEVRDRLSSAGVSATPEGFQHLWDAFIDSYHGDFRTAQASGRLDSSFAEYINSKAFDISKKLVSFGLARVETPAGVMIIRSSSNRPSYWEAVVYDPAMIPYAFFSSKSIDKLFEDIVVSAV